VLACSCLPFRSLSPRWKVPGLSLAGSAPMSRPEALLALMAPENQDIVTGLLISSKEVRIAVPCAVLSKGVNTTGSKVVVAVTGRSQGASVAVDCGKWWRGAPTATLCMDYRQARGAGGGRRLRRRVAASAISGLFDWRRQAVPAGGFDVADHVSTDTCILSCCCSCCNTPMTMPCGRCTASCRWVQLLACCCGSACDYQ
jgi:hypothetical protein